MADSTDATSLTFIGKLHAAKDGDESWAPRVDRDYDQLICHYARQKGAGFSEQQEVKQAVLLELNRTLTLGQFEHAGRPGSFRAYLRLITQRRTIDLIRKNTQPHHAPFDEAECRDLLKSRDTAQENLDAADLRALLDQALAILRQETHGKDAAHIAALLCNERNSKIAHLLMAEGKSRLAADTAISRTREKLRDILTQRLGYQFPAGLAKPSPRRPRKDS